MGREETSGQQSEVGFGRDGSGLTRIELHSRGGVVWLSIDQLAKVFQVSEDVIKMHIENILREDELDGSQLLKRDGTSLKGAGSITISAAELQGCLCSLGMLLAVTYRIRSPRGEHIRTWVTEQISEFLTDHFLMDEEVIGDSSDDRYRRMLRKRLDELETRADVRRGYHVSRPDIDAAFRSMGPET